MRRKYTKGSANSDQKENIENQSIYEEDEDSIAIGIPLIKVGKILKDSTPTPAAPPKSKRSNTLIYMYSLSNFL
jgi:hypothetical protein